MKTPGLIIKAENYKLYEGLRKTTSTLEIGDSLAKLMTGLESS